MNKKTKAIIGAIILLISSVWGWYAAFSDGNPVTTPDTGAVIDAGQELSNAISMDDGDDGATGDAGATEK